MASCLPSSMKTPMYDATAVGGRDDGGRSVCWPDNPTGVHSPVVEAPEPWKSPRILPTVGTKVLCVRDLAEKAAWYTRDGTLVDVLGAGAGNTGARASGLAGRPWAQYPLKSDRMPCAPPNQQHT